MHKHFLEPMAMGNHRHIPADIAEAAEPEGIQQQALKKQMKILNLISRIIQVQWHILKIKDFQGQIL